MMMTMLRTMLTTGPSWTDTGRVSAFVYMINPFVKHCVLLNVFKILHYICEMFEMTGIAIQFDIMKLEEKFKRNMHKQGKILVERKT